VQVLFAVWALVCGALSLPLLVVFPMFGLMFYAPQWLFYKQKKWDIFLVQHRAMGYNKDQWESKTETQQAELLATGQLYERLRGYSVFAALVFGIRLWTFYKAWDWLGTLSDASTALGASAPVWDLPALALTLRWPTELPLPEQLPLFVSAGFVGVEALLAAWRWASKKFGQSTQAEVKRRYDALLGSSYDDIEDDKSALLPIHHDAGQQEQEQEMTVRNPLGLGAETLVLVEDHRQIPRRAEAGTAATQRKTNATGAV